MTDLHHMQDPVCQCCEGKLTTAHPVVAAWFRMLKREFPNVHVAWAYRDELDQTQVYNEGRSKRPWPLSKHNFQKEGRPCSLALDIFQIDEDGVARFSAAFFQKVHLRNIEAGSRIQWGGLFKKFPDEDHFELPNAMA